MKKQKLRFRWWHAPVLLVLSFGLLIGPIDWALRYLSWHNLSKAELIDSANWYIENRAPGNDACLYAVSCENGRSYMKLIKSVDNWDIERTKKLTWDRRFKGVCEGRTANFGLGLVSDRLVGIGAIHARGHAVWSFSNDRFVPVRGRFHGHAFSEKDPEPCTSEYAITNMTIQK